MPSIVFSVILFLSILGLYFWMFIHDRKMRNLGEEPEPLTINVNISTGGDSTSYETSTSSSSVPISEKQGNEKQKISEIPIEVPKKGKDWRDVKITDSFDG